MVNFNVKMWKKITKEVGKNLSSVQQSYSNIERQAVRVLHGLGKFHHYCLAREVHVSTGYKPSAAVPGKDEALLS